MLWNGTGEAHLENVSSETRKCTGWRYPLNAVLVTRWHY